MLASQSWLSTNESPEWRQSQNVLSLANQYHLTPIRFYHSGFISETQRIVSDIMNLLNLNGLEDQIFPIRFALEIKWTVE